MRARRSVDCGISELINRNWYHSSFAGLTRESMGKADEARTDMDARVKPGHDGRVGSLAHWYNAPIQPNRN